MNAIEYVPMQVSMSVHKPEKQAHKPVAVQNGSVLYAEAEPVLVPEAVYEADLVEVRRFSNVFGERVGLVFKIASGPHLGIELMALLTCIERHPGEIVLVQHDGFTAAKRLDVTALERAIQTATGYALTLEEKLVQPDLAEQFGKAVQHEFSKVRNGRKASNGDGFSHIRPTTKTVNSAGAC